MPRKHLAFFLLALFVISACNLGTSAPQGEVNVATAAALTVEAALTAPAASPTSDGPPAGAPGFAPTETPVPGVAIDGTTAEPAACEDQAQINKWVRDFVPFDKTEAEKPLEPGAPFWISLELTNTGTCAWTNAYKWTFNSGERLHIGPDSSPFMQSGFKVNPGDTFTLSLQFKAPTTPGSYESSFSLVNAEGKAFLNFGIPTTVGSPISQSLASPDDLRYTYDCTSGVVNISLFWKDRSNDEAGFRIYRDGEKVGEVAAGSTTYTEIAPGVGVYEYIVAAFNATGEAPAKVEVSTANCQ